MKRKEYYLLGFLFLVVLFIFYPLFYTDYVYMDEALQIWLYNSVPGTSMFIDDGRWLTELLQGTLYRSIHTIDQITWLRLISLFGWLVCLPVWYKVIKRSIGDAPQYEYLPFFTCLYLVTSVPFIVSVQWATCMQFFIASTCGLLSGALFLQGIRFVEKRIRFSVLPVVVALVLGVVSLFTYQNGFGCYLIPFLLHFISVKTANKNKVYILAFVFYIIINAVYFALYKLSLQIHHIGAYERVNLYIAPIEKIKFFLARPLERAFRFTVLTHEDSKISKVYYALMLMGLAVLALIRFGKKNWLNTIKYLAAIALIFLVAYLPGLIVKESFASNRTLQALDILVFIVCLEMVLYFIKNKLWLEVGGYAMMIVFIISAGHNFRNEFLRPIQQETAAIKSFLQQHYHKGIQNVHFIRPSEDFVAEKYHVHKSMDELGVSSSHWVWVPEPLTKQLIYELTGNRKEAAALVVNHWPDKESFIRSGATVSENTLLIDVPAIINSAYP
jgi:hypothetical protein